VIVDLERFLAAEKPHWEELESALARLEREPFGRMDLAAVKRLHYLYERASADMTRLSGYGSELATRRYLEGLVARAYGEIHETRERPHRLRPWLWLTRGFPQAFRRHAQAFQAAVGVTFAGCLTGAVLIALDPGSREVLMPYPHLSQPPGERVAEEESDLVDRLAGFKGRGTAFYVTHNTGVAILTMAAGVAWGIGSVLLLFGNGVLLGAVVTDYALSGQGRFVLGWLLPHGAVEIPAILVAGQAGLVIGAALLGARSRAPLRDRLRAVGPDLVTLIGGVAVLLAWAAVVEAFLSQYHEPVLPYAFKIALGAVEILVLAAWLGRSGRTPPRSAPP
jgi:uncharacterized membrane protein SpoIIM required for sporulation